jgi:hypothetical protein
MEFNINAKKLIMKNLTQFELRQRYIEISNQFQELMGSLHSANQESRLLSKRADNIQNIITEKYR